MYALRITARASKALQKIAEPERTRIEDEIESLATDPRPKGCKKLRGSGSLYRVRIGDYRVIYSIVDKVLLVEITKVGHRREVYD